MAYDVGGKHKSEDIGGKEFLLWHRQTVFRYIGTSRNVLPMRSEASTDMDTVSVDLGSPGHRKRTDSFRCLPRASDVFRWQTPRRHLLAIPRRSDVS